MYVSIICKYYHIRTQGQDKMPMGTNIKMSLIPKGINNPGVSISTPEYVLIPWGYYFFPVHRFLVLSYKRWINYIYYIYIIDPTFTGSIKYRTHAIKEPFRHRPVIIAFYRQKSGGTKTTVSTITA